jgi:uncharacterized cofD-like protein
VSADVVVIAPGDLYTSLAPVLTVDGVSRALKNTKAQIVYVCNLVTKRGHTDGFDVAAHATEIERFVGGPVVDAVLYNTGKPPAALIQKYAEQGELVRDQPDSFTGTHYRTVGANFLAPAISANALQQDSLAHQRTFIRHDARKVARAVLDELLQSSRTT